MKDFDTSLAGEAAPEYKATEYERARSYEPYGEVAALLGFTWGRLRPWGAEWLKPCTPDTDTLERIFLHDGRVPQVPETYIEIGKPGDFTRMTLGEFILFACKNEGQIC